METNRLISRNIRLLIDDWRAFCILGFAPSHTGLLPQYLRIYIKPYDQLVDREAKAHAISITKNLEKGETFESIIEDLTKESVVGNVLHYVKNNIEDIIDCKQAEKTVKLSTAPYRKIK